MFRLKNTKTDNVLNTSIDSRRCFELMKMNAPTDLWDEAINDQNENCFCEIYGKTYSAAEVLRLIDPFVYGKKMNEFWNEAQKDIIADIESIPVGQTRTILGIFEVTNNG